MVCRGKRDVSAGVWPSPTPLRANPLLRFTPVNVNCVCQSHRSWPVPPFSIRLYRVFRLIYIDDRATPFQTPANPSFFSAFLHSSSRPTVTRAESLSDAWLEALDRRTIAFANSEWFSRTRTGEKLEWPFGRRVCDINGIRFVPVVFLVIDELRVRRLTFLVQHRGTGLLRKRNDLKVPF